MGGGGELFVWERGEYFAENLEEKSEKSENRWKKSFMVIFRLFFCYFLLKTPIFLNLIILYCKSLLTPGPFQNIQLWTCPIKKIFTLGLWSEGVESEKSEEWRVEIRLIQWWANLTLISIQLTQQGSDSDFRQEIVRRIALTHPGPRDSHVENLPQWR